VQSYTSKRRHVSRHPSSKNRPWESSGALTHSAVVKEHILKQKLKSKYA